MPLDEFVKVDYDQYKEALEDTKNHIYIQCKNCNKCERIKNIKNIWRGFCENCNKILVADYELTKNAEQISWQDFDYYLRSRKLKETVYRS